MGRNPEDFLMEDVSPEELFISVLSISLSLLMASFALVLSAICPSLCLHLTLSDSKLCPIPMTPNGHLDPSLPLGGHLGPAGAMGPAPRLSLQPDPGLMTLDSRKSSMMSFGRMSYDQRSLVSPVVGFGGCYLLECVGGPWSEVPATLVSLVPRLGHQTVQLKTGRDHVCGIPGRSRTGPGNKE
jgi:hypothetical protein